MTREEIMNMPAGRELDAMIEQHVFGKQVEWVQDDITDPYPIVPAEYSYIVETYSTDISAAWEVVEKFKETEIEITNTVSDGWSVRIGYNPMREDPWWVEVSADTAPLAICRAALIASLEVDRT